MHRGSHFFACYPGEKFPVISVTGNSCDLMCSHCRGKYLKSMIPCKNPEELYTTCKRLASDGALGVLVSGGCNKEGYVPLESYLDIIQRVKEDTGLFIAVHTGLPPAWMIKEIGRAGVDLVDFEVFGSAATVNLITGLDRKPQDYKGTLRKLFSHVPHVVPHICIGVHGGMIVGEEKAVEMVAEFEPEVLVFIIFVPTPGTNFGDVCPPSPEDVGRIISMSRKTIGGEIALGCMRPRGRMREVYELSALNAGVDRMEMPTRRTISEAAERGFRIGFIGACCSVPANAKKWLKWSSA